MASDPVSNDETLKASRPPSRRPSIRDAGLASRPYAAPVHGRSPASSSMALDQPARTAEAAASSEWRDSTTIRKPSRRSLVNTMSSNAIPPSQSGTFLARILGSFRPPPSSPTRPPMPRSLSTPIQLETDVPAVEPNSSPTAPSGSTFLPVSGGFPPVPPVPNPSPPSLTKRFKPSFRRSKSQLTSPKPSPESSPARSPGLSGEPPALTPGSPATLRGSERDPMDRYAASANYMGDGGDVSTSERRGAGGILRRGSMLSQMTVQAQDHAYANTTPQATPLQPIEEPLPSRPPQLDQSLELIATLLPPALLLLSQLGPTHLFSPPLQMPSLFEATLAAAAARKYSISSAMGSNAVLSSGASIASTATGSTIGSTATSAFTLPSTDHLVPSHTHELHAPSTLSVPAVSAAALWRLFRGFEWIGEVGKGEQPLPPSPFPPHLGGNGAGPPLEPTDEPEQLFDFPALLQGVADVLAADAAARGIELVIGQDGNGNAPSPAATPALSTRKEPLAQPSNKDTESRELLVRADERAWSVTLVWILHHILAGASTGSSIDVRFVATSATAPKPYDSEDHPAYSPSRPQKWWTVSVEVVVTSPPPPTLSPTYLDDSSSPPLFTPLPSPPFDTSFAESLFSLVSLKLASGSSDSSSKSWILEALLPAARPRTQSIAEDPSTLLGRRRASLEVSVGQEPSMNELKRYAETALKGLRVALHAGQQSTFAKHLTSYLAGWGMDVQHVPIDHEVRSTGSGATMSDGKPRPLQRFDSGFETAGPSPTNSETPLHKSPEMVSGSSNGSNGDTGSSLVIIDDDVTTLRRLLVSLRAPPLHYAPTLMAKRPQLASRRTRSSPHVRQLHQLSHPTSASQWVIIHFASLTHYKVIKEIVQDTLATSRSPNLPEVLVVPKPAGPRRIITAIWTALKRPAVDPSLPPIATSPTSPGIQYWTPRLSPALAKEQEFDFSSAEGNSGKSSEGQSGATLGKPRTPPIFFNASGQPIGSTVPPSPLGQMSETQDSYFTSVAEELKEQTPSEGMIIQSPDGRSGIFFQPLPHSRRSSQVVKDKAASKPMQRDKPSPGEDIFEEPAEEAQLPTFALRNGDTGETSSGPASRISTYTPLEMGLGSSTAASRRIASASSSHSNGGSVPTAGSASIPPSTPALTLDSFISAAATGRPLTEEALDEEGPHGEPLSRQISGQSGSRVGPPGARRSVSGMSGSSGSAGSPGAPSVTSPRVMPSGTGSSPLFSPIRRGTSHAASPTSSSPASATPGPAAAAGAAAARALAQAQNPTSPAGKRRPTVSSLPKNKRRASRRATLPAVPPISVLIVEDNPINQTILSVFMRKKGISYKVAKDGEQAVQMWKKGNFHLVLMDIQLPVKDGIEATHEIRELERLNNIGTFITTPTSDLNSPMSNLSSNPLSAPTSPLLTMPVIIVALTASSLQADRINALAAGCNDFLTKPVSLTWLESKLVEWGSMAYLSGFSRKSDTSDSSILFNGSRAVTPARPLAPAASTAKFSDGLVSQADAISRLLHIDRSSNSRSSSPAVARLEADAPLSPMTSPDPSPPSGRDAIPHGSAGPALTFTKPTPQDTPDPVPAIPGAVHTPAPAAGGDARHTLDAVEEKLETLVLQQEEDEKPHRPGPTPLPPTVLSHGSGDPELDEVMEEGERLIAVGRDRANSTSFSQAILESGMSSTSVSTVNSGNSGNSHVSQMQLPPAVGPRPE